MIDDVIQWYDTFFMEIDMYHNLYLILKYILWYICDTQYDTWDYDAMIQTSLTIFYNFFLKKIKLFFFG